MPTSHEDRWLLPRRQTEYPARELVAEETLHGRREATFLVLAAVFVVATTALVVLGTSRILDPAPLLAAAVPDVELPIAVQIPFGVLPFALGGLALALVCELYRRRRAAALVAIGVIVSLALAGFMRFADQVDGNDATFGPALGFASCCLAGYLTFLPIFDELRWRMAGRHLWFRLLVSSLAAQLVGWTAFGLVMYGWQTEPATISALAAGSAIYTVTCVVLLTPAIALIARGLRLFLRVAHHDAYDDGYRGGSGDPASPIELTRRRLPPAQIVDNDDIVDEPAPVRPRRARASTQSGPQPYSSTELQFFAEGEQLAESGAES